MRHCTAYSLTSAFSAHRCRKRPVRDGLCAAHLAYPDRLTAIPATIAELEPK